MEIKGKVHEVGQTQQVTDKIAKRELIVEYIENPSYPEYLKFECVQDKTRLLDNVRVGDDVEIFFNLRGRPWTDKTDKKSYFNSMQLWKINVLSANGVQKENTPVDDGSDNLPF